MNREVKESFAVVTGASTGIGYELAVQFAQHGYDVLVVAENNDIKNAARRLAAYGTQIQDLQVDLARREGVENLWMVAYGSGKILITSFVAATTPGPFQSTYNASKAFLKSFAEAIRNQVKDTNVTTLMPGAIETPFFELGAA
jgi:short-subunit dehydrogenase